MLGWFNPNLGQIWTNTNVGLKIFSLSLSTVNFVVTFLTQHLGLSTYTVNNIVGLT